MKKINDSLTLFFCSVITQNYQHILTLQFGVKTINENPKILPNITLGFNVLNGNFQARWILRASVELLSTRDKIFPNYKCDMQATVAVIGGPNADVCLFMADFMYIYKFPQVSCPREHSWIFSVGFIVLYNLILLKINSWSCKNLLILLLRVMKYIIFECVP